MAKNGKYNTPYAELVPRLSSEEFAALKSDIKANGVLYPAILDEENNVLDGHNRLRIDPDAPTKVVKGLSPGQKEAFVWRANNARRNKSPDQRRESLERMKKTAEKLRGEDPKRWTQAAVAKELGVARSTVAMWFMPNVKGDKTHKSSPDAPILRDTNDE